MTRFILIFCLVARCAIGADIYVAQNAAGAATGANCANAQSLIWLNNNGFDWSVNNLINPGDKIHLCGMATNVIVIRGSGTPGNRISFIGEPGSDIQQPGAPGSMGISCQSRSYIYFTNVFIEYTNSGSLLGITNAAPAGIYASGSDHVEVDHCTFQNFYVHVPGGDTANNNFDASGAVYFNGFGSGISIHDCTFTNIGWCISLGNGSGSGYTVVRNTFQNYDHGVAGFTPSQNLLMSDINISSNHFGATGNWDTTANEWHHDGIHIFCNAANCTSSNVTVAANLFDGDWGTNNTAFIFIEGDDTHVTPNLQKNYSIYNNVFLTTNYLNDGFMAAHGPNWLIANNTCINSGTYQNTSAFSFGTYAMTGLTFVGNLIQGVTTYMAFGETGPVNFSNNLYSATAPGGNAPWARAGVNYNTLAAWQGTVGDANSTFSTPLVASSTGPLLAGSPGIGAGANLSPLFTTDYQGLHRVSPWDIGAFSVGTFPASILVTGQLTITGPTIIK